MGKGTDTFRGAVICEKHGKWPCRICGTKHFDGCRCYCCREEPSIDPKSRKIEVRVVAEIYFEIEADDYLQAFNEAVSSIQVDHPGYKYAGYS